MWPGTITFGEGKVLRLFACARLFVFAAALEKKSSCEWAVKRVAKLEAALAPLTRPLLGFVHLSSGYLTQVPTKKKRKLSAPK